MLRLLADENFNYDVSPKDVLATSLHLMGFDPHSTVPDLQGKPMPVVGEGVVRAEMVG